MIDIPADLPADLVPLAWLRGVWEGSGVIDYTAGDAHFTGEFVQRVSFSHDGSGALNYSASAQLTGDGRGENFDEGDPRRIELLAESGYWRLSRPRSETDAGPGLLPPLRAGAPRTPDDVEALRTSSDGFEIEASIVHSDGMFELYLGQVRGPRIDLATDAVVRGAGAKAYAAATRMYGLVDGHLLWAWDIAALGQALGSHASARLEKVQ